MIVKLKLIVLIILIMFGTNAFCGKLFVQQNLKVHTEANLESPVSFLLLGGKQISALNIDGDFTEIKDDKNRTGWVSSEFLVKIVKSDDSTTSTTTKKQAKNLNPELKKVKSTSTVKKDNKKVKTTTYSSKPKVEKELDKSSSKTAPVITTPEISNQSKEKQQLADLLVRIETSNKQLKQQLEQVKNLIPNNTLAKDKNSYQDMHFIALGVSLVVGFFLGMFWRDYRYRLRHGGFKI